MFADIILPINLPRLLTYGVPLEMQATLKPGMRVEVSLGKNKVYSGVVDNIHQYKPDSYQVKPIKSIIDQVAVVTEQQLKFWRWIGDYYIASPGEVMQAALPAHLKLMAETRLQWIGENTREMVWSTWALAAIDNLILKKEITISELRAVVGVKHFAAVLNELLENEAVFINDSLESDYKPRKERLVVLAPQYLPEPALIALFDQLQRAPKQLALLMAYTEISVKKGFVKQVELMERTGTTAAQVKTLVEKGVFFIEEKEVDRIPMRLSNGEKEIVFTLAQTLAYADLTRAMQEKNVTLMHGVTGSGKTMLYVRKIKECVAAGGQALLLLPEIALTTHLTSRLLAYFGDELGVYHSHFSNNERVEIWEKVRKGIYKVVVGPRSALWLPFINPALIIVDEEHDSSYKQRDPAPRFHARDAAIYLASLFNAKVILGSATPSLESLYNVQQEKYAYASLKDRYQGVKMPAIQLVDARSLARVKKVGAQMITPELQLAIHEALMHRKQVILFQNRRGYSPFQLCTVCGWVPQCKNCAVSLTYHKSTDKLHCHYCGAKSAVMNTCPQCGSNCLSSKTFGTEKIEEEVQELFPKARVARMDVDSMRKKNSMAELLEQLGKNKIDILVGTQMVVKGLDFASVSLVGILSADSLLSFPDFRVNERAFQLMEQVSGRAGRADGEGKVLIQTFNLDHPVLKWVTDHDISTFYLNEIKYREYFGYPPFSRLIKVTFRHENEAKAIAAATQMAQSMNAFTATAQQSFVVQGPGPAIVPRVRNQFIQEIWLKCRRDFKSLESIKTFLRAEKQHLLSLKNHGGVQVIFDIDPV
ncbi:MAG: primosomal protein N' [Taibaiella sp.]|nr:primosomal protein N' [Taibaiella sp.]